MTRSLRLLVAAVLATPAALAAQAPVMNVANVRAAAPALDSAIARLEGFLARYPNSPLRPNALLELGELQVRRADEEFAATQRTPGATPADTSRAANPAQRAQANAAIRPDYSSAIRSYEELVTRYPSFEQIDAAMYTLGTLYGSEQRYADAARMFEAVSKMTTSPYRAEAYFRLGDALFEVASRERGDARRARFGQAAAAYEQAVSATQPPNDIHFLALYKLGWSYYNQANQANQAEYQKAVDVFGRLVDAYDKLTPDQQSRLGLRGEAIEYMAVAFTQVGGAEAANRYFASRGGAAPYSLTLMRRVAQTFRDQGNFPEAIHAYRMVIQNSPTDSSVLTATREIAEIYQHRLLERDSAQAARMQLADLLAPGGAWARANPQLADSAARLRESALRESGQYLLASAQAGNRARFGEAAQIYQRYLTDFSRSDSAQIVNRYYGEALFGAGEYARAGAEFSKTAFGYGNTRPELAQEAGRNAIVAYDSALVRNKGDRAAQDSLFATVDRFVAAFPQTDVAKKALIEKGRRASETQRWDAMEAAFRTYVANYPNDPYTPTAQRLIGDALYRGGQYAQAQTQWESAQQVAASSGRRALVDSITSLRENAAAAYADSLIKRGQYSEAAEQVYVAYAKANPNNAKAPDALRNAIETYMLADSVAGRNNEGASRQARERAVELSGQLAQQYPNYRYRQQYQVLRARLLGDLGRREESVQAYQQLIQDNPNWSGRADAMVRVAVMLDSLGKKREAAAAYEQFATSYPRDDRAAGSLWNAAATYAEAPDPAAAARTYALFAQRYPRDERAAQARRQQIALLQTAGDTAAATAALANACARPTADMRAECAGRVAARAFQTGVETYRRYAALTLRIPSKAQLTQAGVNRASRDKQALLRQLTAQFADVIRSGVPEYLAAASYYVGLAQHNYGDFLKNVQLPENLTEAERTAAQQGAAQQAEQYYSAAKQVWQELVQRAESTPQIKDDPKAAPWVDRARAAVQGNVDTAPPGAGGA
jgi:TolA-binding protein